MLQKFIVAEVEHNKKRYKFHETYLDYDKDKSSLILDDEYVKNDLEEENICYLYSVFRNMVTAGIYSSVSSIERAVKNGVVRANLIIIYMTNIDNVGAGYHYKANECKSLEDLDKYCSGIHYMYDLKDKSITRYELYGDPILGDEICRPISDLKSKKDKEG